MTTFASPSVVVCTVLWLLAGCTETRAPLKLSGPTMGTHFHVAIARPTSDVDAAALRRDIDVELNRINAQMSTYLPDSEISTFNAYTGDDWFAVSPEFAQVVDRARHFSQRSGGAFDVTVGRLVNRWNFGPNKASDKAPSDREIQELLAAVGFQLVEVRNQPPALRKQRPDVHIDLSAIAKGFAVDRVAELLRSRGVKDFMVEIGGEIRVSGTNERAAGWTIGIEEPVAHRRVLHRALSLRDASLATSGDYRNFIEIDGRRFSHIISPRSGRPVDHRLASISVIAADCLSADAWATALFVLGPADGYELAQREGIAALFIVRADNGFVEKSTTEMNRLIGPHQDVFQ